MENGTICAIVSSFIMTGVQKKMYSIASAWLIQTISERTPGNCVTIECLGVFLIRIVMMSA
jgi:hypothetical protein